jgi:aspartyl-tRNA(Asn)/glutamyl-tRNA(Gln) amidotransferase subunit B
MLEQGHEIESSTLTYNPIAKQTELLRRKDTLMDYRYMPDPELPEVCVSSRQIELWRSELPELPDAKRERYMGMGLNVYQANTMLAEPGAPDIFDRVLAVTKSGKAESACNLLMNTLMGELRQSEITYEMLLQTSPVLAVEQIASIVDALDTNRIFLHETKSVIRKMMESSDKSLTVDRFVHQSKTPNDTDRLLEIARQVLAENPKSLADLKGGKAKVVTFVTGQIMRKVSGRADPAEVKKALDLLLRELSIDVKVR